MRTWSSYGIQVVAFTLVVAVVSGLQTHVAAARSAANATTKTWLDTAVREKRCPPTPVNVPAAVLQTVSGDVLQQQISSNGNTLQIAGTANSDHIVIAPGNATGMVRIVFNGKRLGSFGPVTRLHVQGGDGDDVVIVEPNVDLPTRIEGGAGDDCLQSGTGPALLFGGDGDDVLIAGTGRPWLDAGNGNNRIVFPPSMGELRMARSVDGDLLPLLARAYTLKPLRGHPKTREVALPSPILLGPADLSDARTVAAIKDAYAAGQTVALLNATAADYARLRAVLGHPNAADGPTGSETADLYFVRKVLRPGTLAYDYQTGLFQHDPTALSSAPGRDLTQRRLELLSRVFAAGANVRDDCPTNSGTNDLTCLADNYFSTSTSTYAPTGSSDTLSDSVYNVRSFLNQDDFYYVYQVAEYTWGANQSGLLSQNLASNGLIGLGPTAPVPVVIRTTPQSTHCTVSTTSGVNWNIGGSVGWNWTQGANAALTGGVSVDNSQTITCPQISINNQVNPAAGLAQWTYFIPPPAFPPGTTQFINQWLWEIPFSSYGHGQQGVGIVSAQNSAFFLSNSPLLQNVVTRFIPLPFGDTFALQNPMVLSVNPTCVNAGDKFTINGSGFYPSLVTSVQIAGTAVDMGAITVESDKAISVVAPDMSEEAAPVVVQTAVGQSNSNVAIEISVIDICNLASGAPSRPRP